MTSVTAPRRVHILLPVHNRRAVTLAFVRCLQRQTYDNWHLVLVDDGSRDGTGDAVRALVPNLTLLRGKGQWWWGGSLHQAYRWMRRNRVPENDIALIINDDTEIAPEFLSNAVRAIRPNCLLLAQAYKENGEFCEAGVFWDWKNLVCAGVKASEEINCFSTRGLFLRVGDFLKIGGFYPHLLPHYLSDYEFTIRAARKGFSLTSAPDVSLRYFDGLTGIRNTDGLSTWKTLKTNLSIKSTANPLYWTSFLLLSCPRKYLGRNLARVWWRYLGPVRNDVSSAFAPVRRRLSPVRAFLRRAKGKAKREWARLTAGPGNQ
jgi:GT2 family glycosyltransferase